MKARWRARLVSLLRPTQEHLFQRVLAGIRPTIGPWFANAPLSHKSIADMMPLLCVRAKLSTHYSNHCICATIDTELKDARFSNYEVCAVTGHQHEASLQHFDRLDRRKSKRQSDKADVGMRSLQ